MLLSYVRIERRSSVRERLHRSLTRFVTVVGICYTSPRACQALSFAIARLLELIRLVYRETTGVLFAMLN